MALTNSQKSSIESIKKDIERKKNNIENIKNQMVRYQTNTKIMINKYKESLKNAKDPMMKNTHRKSIESTKLSLKEQVGHYKREIENIKRNIAGLKENIIRIKSR